MNFGELALRSVDWSKQEVLGGESTERVAEALHDLVTADARTDFWAIWWRLENSVFAQNTLYGSAEAVVGVAVAALADAQPAEAQSWAVEVIRFILARGGSVEDPGLSERCRLKANAGFWLIAAKARSADPEARAVLLELLAAIDPAATAQIFPAASA